MSKPFSFIIFKLKVELDLGPVENTVRVDADSANEPASMRSIGLSSRSKRLTLRPAKSFRLTECIWLPLRISSSYKMADRVNLGSVLDYLEEDLKNF
ncbi:hypothetical protein BpHYR1_042142 [Brachionus plicatilis]|uniref:Uncharacterized protein n=1 Tax=Brachionus plicatilis TaxID=10195 RepID=A0A3M7R2D3_BRAPC|nr:hypothetical protein BpHYR1_042142 [Brachionus plicatilis]